MLQLRNRQDAGDKVVSQERGVNVKPVVVAEYKGELVQCPFCPCRFACEWDLKLHLFAWGVDPDLHRQRWRDMKRQRK